MKKKILFLSAILTLGFAANSFALATDITGGTWTAQTDGVILIGTLQIKPSANVTFAYKHTVVSAAPVAYAIGTQHTSGSFRYATSSTDTNIYRTPDLTAALVAAPASATAGVDWTGWTAAK